MNTAAISTVYNHYLTSYAPKGTTSFDLHKKSELRKIYNSIVKINKEAPLYKLDTSRESQAFAVGIKESARDFHNTIASLGGLRSEDVLSQKIAYSSNENIATAEYTGDAAATEEVPSYDLEVKSLALPQINTGHYLLSAEMDLPADTYSFDLGINDTNYEFQFSISEDDTNLDLQKKLARLVNNAGVGVKASLLEDGIGSSALRLESVNTGRPPLGRTSLFSISDDHTSKKAGVADYLGINEITRKASDSSIILNGEEQSTNSNTFTILGLYNVTLNGISPETGSSTHIGLKTDMDSLKDNIHKLSAGYNNFLKSAYDYKGIMMGANTLADEIKRISSYFGSDLDLIGLHKDSNGYIAVNDEHLAENAEALDAAQRFSPIKDFTNSLLRKTDQVSLNPMNYVNKTVVIYKNPGKNFPSPYVISAYSGLLFNSYV